MTTPMGSFYAIPSHPVINPLPAIVREVLGKLYWHRNRVTGQCNPRHETLARALGCSESTIQRAIRMLRERRVLRATKGRRGNQYEIRPTEEWRRPTPTPCPVTCEEAPVKRQGHFILNEQEALFLKENDAAPLILADGGGGSPAALPEKTKTPEPAPVIPAPEAKRAMAPEPTPVSTPPLKQAEELVMELMPKHPVAGNPSGAVRAIASVLVTGSSPEAIRASHAQFCRLWACFTPGRFIPMLARWINDNDWRYPPDEKQIIASRGEPPEDPAERERRREAAERLEAGIRAEKEAQRARMQREFERDLAEGRIIGWGPDGRVA